MVNILQSVTENLKQIGINATVQEIDHNQWLAGFFRHENLGTQIMSYYPDFADPANYPYLFFHSANAAKDGMNGSNFKNAEVDVALDVANQQSDAKVRAEALKKVFALANEACRGRADLLAGVGDGNQQQVQTHRLQRLLVQYPLGNPRLRLEVGAAVPHLTWFPVADMRSETTDPAQSETALMRAVTRLDQLRFPSASLL